MAAWPIFFPLAFSAQHLSIGTYLFILRAVPSRHGPIGNLGFCRRAFRKLPRPGGEGRRALGGSAGPKTKLTSGPRTRVRNRGGTGNRHPRHSTYHGNNRRLGGEQDLGTADRGSLPVITAPVETGVALSRRPCWTTLNRLQQGAATTVNSRVSICIPRYYTRYCLASPRARNCIRLPNYICLLPNPFPPWPAGSRLTEPTHSYYRPT